MLSKDYTQFLSETKLPIFLFHGVIEKEISDVRNYNKKHILKSDFSSLIKELNLKGQALNLDEASELIKKKKNLPQKSFVVTFDDGFHNNKSIAAEILNENKVPATFYITTKFIDENLMSWIDQIEYCVEQTDNKDVKLSFFEDRKKLGTAKDKINFLEDIRHLFKNNKNAFERKEKFIEELFQKLDVSYVNQSNDELNKKMSWEDVKELHSNSLFTVGGHTVSHPIMSFLSQSELEIEIKDCIKKISEKLNFKIKHFSYPEGLEHCFNTKVIDILKSHFIKCSPSAIFGINRLGDDLFNLKRIPVV